MNVFALVSAVLALVLTPKAPLQINVDAKNGDTLTGLRSFRVTVDSQNETVNQVEFYVGSDLRDTQTSTPYMFQFDTIDEQDGDVTLKFKAYTTTNTTAEKTLTLHIDNKKSQGADFHVKAGQDALSNSDWSKALDQGRIALKIDPASVDARIVLARANLGLKVFDKAQLYAEDAVKQSPKSDSALQLLAGIAIQKAFNTYAHSTQDRAQTLTDIGDAFKAAIAAKVKSNDLEVENAGQPSGDNVAHYADTLLHAQRYSAAISAIAGPFQSDAKNTKLCDRLAYAQLRSGRYNEALNTLTNAKTFAPLDAYALAVQSVMFVELSRDGDADEAMKNAIESDPDNLGVQTAQAFIALKRNKTAVLAGIVNELAKDQGSSATVAYLLMALADRLGHYNDSRKYFERAVLADPTFADAYIEQANYAITFSLQKNIAADQKTSDLNEAKMYFQVAQQARPESPAALAGIATVDIMLNNHAEAVKYAEAARDAAPFEAAGHYVASAAYQAAGKFSDAQRENQMAGKLDTTYLLGREIPTAVGVWVYLNGAGRVPLMMAPQ